MSRTAKTGRARQGATGNALETTRRRVNQESVDAMAELRRQGLTFKEIGARLGCSERTARRYAGRVEPQIQLPPATTDPEPEDPRRLRERLARWFSDFLYEYPAHPRPRESVRFIAEANRMIGERLDLLDPLTLELLSKDVSLRGRFLKETIGQLYGDFRSHIQWDAQWTMRGTAASPTNWLPPLERPAIYADDDDFDVD